MADGHGVRAHLRATGGGRLNGRSLAAIPKKTLAIGHSERTAGLKVAEAILGLIGQVPNTVEPKSTDPGTRARAIADRAAMTAALTAGSLALAPGPLGWLAMLPELLAVWKLQAQMVADIARIYDRNAYLTREQMRYCLLRHTAAQAVWGSMVRVGERILVQGCPLARCRRSHARSVSVSSGARSERGYRHRCSRRRELRVLRYRPSSPHRN
jgi:hypothetical protein